MPCVKIVVLIVELTPLPPKGEVGGAKQTVPLLGLRVSEKKVLYEKRKMRGTNSSSQSNDTVNSLFVNQHTADCPIF